MKFKSNPCLQDMVKNGYAADVEVRRKQLSTTALPYEYEVYAVYETPGKLEDKKLHKLIDNLNTDLRVSKNREFFLMTPEDAYELLEAIAIISGSQDNLKLLQPGNKIAIATNTTVAKKPRIDFYKCGLKDGDELVYVEDDSVRVTVSGEHKVLYKGELTSLSKIAMELRGTKAEQGPKYFTHNGESLVTIAERSQWK